MVANSFGTSRSSCYSGTSAGSSHLSGVCASLTRRMLSWNPWNGNTGQGVGVFHPLHRLFESSVPFCESQYLAAVWRMNSGSKHVTASMWMSSSVEIMRRRNRLPLPRSRRREQCFASSALPGTPVLSSEEEWIRQRKRQI
jgi:hypothetical protein